MNKNISLIISILFIVLSFNACKKDNAINTENQLNKKEMANTEISEKIARISNPYPIEDYTLNAEDPDDEKINQHLLKITRAARELIYQQNLNNLILEMAANNDIQIVDLNELAQNAKINSEDGTFLEFIEAVKHADLTHASTNPEKDGEIENYLPSIYVPNLTIADEKLSALICPAFEVNCELSGMEQYEDYIVAWYYDENNVLCEILIDEETVMNTNHPVFIINNAEISSANGEKTYEKIMEPQIPSETKTQTAYHSNEYQINKRYENSGKSEFCIAGAHIKENGEVNLILQKNYHFELWKEIAKVPKNKIGKALSHWEQICSNEVQPFNSNYVYWNTFERDWYSSQKSLGSATKNGTTITLRGNRKYSGEWYAYDPGSLAANPLDLHTIYYSWAKWHTNSKTKLRIWRVEL